ncbi:acetate/propionate family kinase [bacterium]|nr:MAG: acetate/propionate family kinase [bacterium]
MEIITLNVGSSSLRAGVVRWVGDDASTAFERVGSLDDATAILAALEAYEHTHESVLAVAHRVVHAGRMTARAEVLDEALEREIERATPLAPHHNPAALRVINLARQCFPRLPQVAAFDSAFHATLPLRSAVYPLPYAWFERGVRRLGFHGLSHAYASRRAAKLLRRPPSETNAIVCHLGSGASLCAVAGGCSVDTTMGYTPLEGLMMGTRSGSLDPGILFHALREGAAPERLEQIVDTESGFAGLAGRSNVREVLEAASAGEERACLAVDVYVHRLRREMAAMLASLTHVHALVFTGGVGEHAPSIRERACRGFETVGWTIDAAANEGSATDDRDVAAASSRTRIFVIHAREDIEMARATRDLLAPQRRGSVPGDSATPART